MSRRPHPYFGRINRLEGARLATPGDGRGRAPAMAADEQQGVLWTAFREAEERPRLPRALRPGHHHNNRPSVTTPAG